MLYTKFEGEKFKSENISVKKKLERVYKGEALKIKHCRKRVACVHVFGRGNI